MQFVILQSHWPWFQALVLSIVFPWTGFNFDAELAFLATWFQVRRRVHLFTAEKYFWNLRECLILLIIFDWWMHLLCPNRIIWESKTRKVYECWVALRNEIFFCLWWMEITCGRRKICQNLRGSFHISHEWLTKQNGLENCTLALGPIWM